MGFWGERGATGGWLRPASLHWCWTLSGSGTAGKPWLGGYGGISFVLVTGMPFKKGYSIPLAGAQLSPLVHDREIGPNGKAAGQTCHLGNIRV